MHLNSSTTNKISSVIKLEPIPSAKFVHDENATEIPDWQPWPLKTPFFAVALTLTLLHSTFCMALVVLSYTSSSMLSSAASSVGSYFFWQYVPMMFAVVPGLLWEIAYIAMCRMQPFRDLATPNGSSLKNSLSQNYLTSFSWLVPYRAFTHPNNHLGLAFMSIAYLLSYHVLPPCTAAMIKFGWTDGQGSVEPVIYFVVLAFAVSVAASCFAGAAFIVSRRQRTGLFGNPAGVGGIGALIANSDILAKFQSVRSYDTQARIDQVLGEYQLCLEPRVGRQDTCEISLLDSNQHVLEHPEPPFQQSELEAHPWWLRGRTYIALVLLQLAPSIYVRVAPGGSNSPDPFALKICFTILNVTDAAIWSGWHMNVALLEPFYRLTKHKGDTMMGSPCALNIEFTGSAVSNLFYSMRKSSRSLSVWWISMCAFTIQLSVIFSPGLVQNQAFMISVLENAMDSDVAAGLQAVSEGFYALAITLTVLMMTGVVFVLTRKRKPFLPRKPYTLSSTILYLCHSEDLLKDVQELSSLPRKVRDRHLAQSGNRYGMGWIKSRVATTTGTKYNVVGIERLDRVRSPFKFDKTGKFLQDER